MERRLCRSPGLRALEGTITDPWAESLELRVWKCVRTKVMNNDNQTKDYNLSPQGPRWTVCVGGATLKGTRGDWLCEKASELGAFALQPLACERSKGTIKERKKEHKVLHDSDSVLILERCNRTGGRESRYQRWSRISVSAAKQSLRLHCLDLNPEMEVKELARKIKGTDTALLAKQGGSHIGSLVGESLLEGNGYLIIGPEGGTSRNH